MHIHQRYAVYHANDLFAMALPEASHWYGDRSRYYTHVADVEAPLEQVFALTNHIDHPWMSNPQVIWHATTVPLRSTSVGDVIGSCRGEHHPEKFCQDTCLNTSKTLRRCPKFKS
jgi:hypothetical protein